MTDCLGLEDNSAKMTGVGLRIGQLTFAKPDALKLGVVKTIVDQAVSLNLSGQYYTGAPSSACNLNGKGWFSWLLDFDLPNGTLKTGGAKPVGDPHGGFCFVNQVLGGFQVQPTVLDALVGADGSFAVTTGQDLVVPMFLDPGATKQLLFPLHQVKFNAAKLSMDKNCIGSFNGDEFSAANSCLPDTNASPPQTYFTNGATLDALITLEDADKVVEPTTGEPRHVRRREIAQQMQAGCAEHHRTSRRLVRRDQRSGHRVLLRRLPDERCVLRVQHEDLGQLPVTERSHRRARRGTHVGCAIVAHLERRITGRGEG